MLTSCYYYNTADNCGTKGATWSYLSKHWNTLELYNLLGFILVPFHVNRTIIIAHVWIMNLAWLFDLFYSFQGLPPRTSSQLKHYTDLKGRDTLVCFLCSFLMPFLLRYIGHLQTIFYRLTTWIYAGTWGQHALSSTCLWSTSICSEYTRER